MVGALGGAGSLFEVGCRIGIELLSNDRLEVRVVGDPRERRRQLDEPANDVAVRSCRCVHR
jgi:hypothetical protein